MKAAVLGAGVIGAGWAARFVCHGWDVALWDPDQRAVDRALAVSAEARALLSELYDVPLPVRGEFSICKDPAEAVHAADWVQESIPEDFAVKRELFTTIADALPADIPLASSTSGFKPSELAAETPVATQLLVCHPFNPVYLLPGVEVVPGKATRVQIRDRAMALLADIGMHPTHVRHEIDAHIADRLLEAIWREALWLVHDGVASTGEIDAVIRNGFGLRWAQMGLFETYRLGGGERGFRHFLEQFGPALEWPWSKLTDVPELSPELIDRIVSQSDEQAGDLTVDAQRAQRDRNLVALLRALKAQNAGAGVGLNKFERKFQPD